MNFKILESKQKLRGGYYTPPPIAEFLCSWAFEDKPETVLEPSCGDGAFLSAIETCLDDGVISHKFTIDAVEIIEEEAKTSKKYVSPLRKKGVSLTVKQDDFFSWLITKPVSKQWDAIVGNPPYIRYQYWDNGQREQASELFKTANIKFTKRTNSWVPFVIASIMHLSPGGRIAMVIPAEISYIIHADGLRRFLEQEFSRLRLVYFNDIVFKETLQGTVLLLGKRRKDRGFLPLLDNGSRTSLFRESSGRTTDFSILDINNISDLDNLYHELSSSPSNNISLSSNWMLSLLKKHELKLVRELVNHEGVLPFRDIADVDIGIVTGANNFFCVSEVILEKYNLESFAHPMYAKSELIKGITYTLKDHTANAFAGKNVYFLLIPSKPFDELPDGLVEYLRLGEKQSIHKRYKCRIRQPWYVVPYTWTSEIALLKRCHLYHRLVLNKAKAYSTDTAYRVKLVSKFKQRGRDLIFSFLNSLTLLSAEIGGRNYAGGVLELVPSEIEELPIPMVSISKSDFYCLDKMIRAGTSLDAILDFTDKLILEDHLGLDQRSCRKLRSCYKRLQARRLRISQR